jgi:hypothetical protein
MAKRILRHTAHTMSKQHLQLTSVVDELGTLVSALQASLREALRSVLPDLGGARACGRALGLKRGLGWSLYTVLTVEDPPTILRSMPRRAGWELIFESLKRLECQPRLVAALRRSVKRLLDRLEDAALDRSMLRAAAAGGLDTTREITTMLKSRRSMRRSAEEVHGLRVQAKIGSFLIGPADRKGFVDLIALLEYESLKRLRPGHPFPIHQRVQAWHPTMKDLKYSAPLKVGGAIPGLVGDLSTAGVAAHDLEVGTGDDERTIFFHGERTFARESVRITFAECLRKAGSVGHQDDLVNLDLAIYEPAAFVVVEAWIHESIRRTTEPAAMLYMHYGSSFRLGERRDRVRVPLEAEVKPISNATLPAIIRGSSVSHEKVLIRGAETLKAPLDEFVGYRVVVPDPPIGSRIMLEWRM